MTEEDARKKWCPMVRQGEEGAGSWNRGSGDDPINLKGGDGNYKCNCLASDCAMWRSVKKKWTSSVGGFTEEYTEGGYCGLAGKE